MCLTKLWIDGNGFAEVLDGGIEIALAGEHDSGANLALRQIAIHFDLPELLDFGKLLARGRPVAGLPGQVRQRVTSLHGVGVETNRSLERGFLFVVFAKIVERAAQLQIELSGLRVQLCGGLQLAKRAVPVPGSHK